MQLSNLLKCAGFCNTSTKLILVGLQHLTCVTADLFSPKQVTAMIDKIAFKSLDKVGKVLWRIR